MDDVTLHQKLSKVCKYQKVLNPKVLKNNNQLFFLEVANLLHCLYMFLKNKHYLYPYTGFILFRS